MSSSASTSTGSTSFYEICDKILADISGTILRQDSSGLFQNHLFGCLSLLEYLDEGRAMLDNNKIHFQDISDNLTSIDISSEFHLIGDSLGFWSGTSQQAWQTPWEISYPHLWQSLFSLIHESTDTCGIVEDFEEKCYNLCLDCLGESCPFVVCIEKGECERPVATVSVCESASAAVPAPVKPKPKFRHTARLKRAVTPIFKRKGFNKTYKNN